MSDIDVYYFTKNTNTNKSKPDGRFGQKAQFKKSLEAYEFDKNLLIAEFAKYGLYMLENGTRKKDAPAVPTMVTYISLIKTISLLLDGTNILSLDDFQLCSLFEQVQEIKGNNKSTNSSLLNLFTYLNEARDMSLKKMDLVILSTEKVDKNLLWDWEVKAILESDELSELDKLFILILFECGPRITEAYQLIGEDIDIVGELLHLRTNRLGKMKNRYSIRCLPMQDLSEELVVGLLSNAKNMKSAIFDFDKTQNKQNDFRGFCLRINDTIKKVTERNVSLKHLRHSRVRAKFLAHKNETSLRSYYQDAGNIGHSNLLTGQKNYIQSVFEENMLIEASDEDTAAFLDITPANVRQKRCRFRNKNPTNKMTNTMLNAFLSMEYIKNNS